MIRGYVDVLRSYWPMLVFGLLTVFFGNFGQSFFISWFGAPIQEKLGLSASAYGSAYSVATLVSGLTIMAIGGLVDKLALRLFVTLIALGLFTASLLMWQMNSLFSLVIALFMLRFFGQGLMPHTAMTVMGRYFSVNRGKSISIAGNGVPLGEMILPSLLVLIIALVGWQNSWLVVAIVIIGVYLPTAHWLLHRAGPSEVERLGMEKRLRPDNVPDGSRRTVLKDERFWLALPLLLAPGLLHHPPRRDPLTGHCPRGNQHRSFASVIRTDDRRRHQCFCITLVNGSLCFSRPDSGEAIVQSVTFNSVLV